MSSLFMSSSKSKLKSKSSSGGLSSSSGGGRYDKTTRSSAAESDISSFSSTTHRNNNAITITKKSSKTKSANLNLTGMVNKLIMEKKSSSSLSKASAKGKREFTGNDITNYKNNNNIGLVGLMHKKLFGDKKALISNNNSSRSLGMVLKSERELLNVNKEQEELIIQLNSLLVQKNTEIDKLKDLCLKQREEINSLKTAILFPPQDHHHHHHKELSSSSSSSSMSLQMQVTSLTNQLHSLAHDLAQVKADKYSVQGSYDDGLVTSSNLTHDQEEASNSLEFSTTPGSPDDMFLNDLNPCLTPYAKSKSKDFGYIESHSSSYNSTRCHEVGFGSHGRKL
uniref:serine/threonine-protein kinase pakF n=1 Tax=Erigeron canadensis TaxID=72917 RepID=UPI001CB91835|nr:serine/threonine-protein kinase pakF [Erigeron canadensis]